MTKMALVVIFSLTALSSFAENNVSELEKKLIEAQEALIESHQVIINLQTEINSVKQKLVKTYKATNLCYPSLATCRKYQNLINLLPSKHVSISTLCKQEYNMYSFGCSGNGFGNRWILHTEIRILP